VSLGAIVYFVVIQAVLSLLNVDPQYLKLFSAIIVAIFLTVPNIKTKPRKHHNAEKEEKVC